MRIHFVVIVVAAVLATAWAIAASDAKVAQVTSDDAPLSTHVVTPSQREDDTKTRSLRYIQSDEKSTGNDEERAFNALQGLQDLFQKWKAQRLENEGFMKLIQAGETPSTLYRSWGLHRIDERIVNDADYELWLRFREYWRWVKSA